MYVCTLRMIYLSLIGAMPCDADWVMSTSLRVRAGLVWKDAVMRDLDTADIPHVSYTLSLSPPRQTRQLTIIEWTLSHRSLLYSVTLSSCLAAPQHTLPEQPLVDQGGLSTIQDSKTPSRRRTPTRRAPGVAKTTWGSHNPRTLATVWGHRPLAAMEPTT